MTAEAVGPAPVPAAAPVRRWPRRMAYGAAGIAVLVPSGTAGAGWYFASQTITPSRVEEYPLDVRAVDGDQVTLTRTEETERTVPQGLVWAGGHARLGGLVRADRSTVVRRVVHTTRGTLRTGLRAYQTGFVFDGDPRTARGLDFTEVMIPGELGDLPAWRLGRGRTWVIAVHGRAAHRGETLRALPTMHRAGVTTLAVTYRNDVGAPAAPDGAYHLGDTEWRDIEAALRYASAHGATDVILHGWSMGGAIALNTVRRSPLASLVRGVVLDCPVIDWVATLRMHAAQRRLPQPLTWAALRLIEQRLGLRLADLDQRRFADELRVPVLVFLDADDTFVAQGPTRDLAAARPDLVTLVETAGGGHTRSWNADPDRYETALARFLR